MSIKKKIGLGVASGALGLAMISGGTWAAFSDSETLADNDFFAGTLDLKPEMESSALFEISDLAPGDTMTRNINLTNAGSVDIKHVWFDVTYTLNDVANPTGVPIDPSNMNKLEDDIKVSIFNLDGSPLEAMKRDNTTLVLTGLTLKELRDLGEVDISRNGLAAGSGDSDRYEIKLEYVNLGNQNHQQGDSITAQLIFNAQQRDGMERANTGSGTPTGNGDVITD
ncbi:hypothetical protein ABE41_017165 [Fictibacillus arsenicus]|uniref:Cell division protein FtsN n=1 Tax=Fictibacillus arsenicus TaxID=255247 RepID=A0A1B1Z8E1_9BACL|nr:TasA family protein [Fictibacillus arsenicus]ANX13742.1 hypothetical protein ABE41_017165 [Fictibacillus arsenicus]